MSKEWMPGAIHKPLDTYYEGKELRGMNHTPFARKRRDGGVLHSAASSANGETHWKYWNRDKQAGVSSHLYVDYDGPITQMVPLSHKSWTSVEANDRMYGVETQGFPHEPWTKAQIKSLAEIIRWTSDVEKTPIRLMTSTSKLERGIGHHQTKYGGELWNPGEHNCPGRLRIAQIPEILALAKGLNPITETKLVVDGSEGPLTIKKLQRVFGTTVDGVLSKPSLVIREFQKFLNTNLHKTHIKNLTGKSSLVVDGHRGPDTTRAFQYWSAINFPQHLKTITGWTLDPHTQRMWVDGSFGPRTIKMEQLILNQSIDGSKHLG